MNTDILDRNKISERIIGCAFMVAGTLGAGFLEKVYENALPHEIRKAGWLVEQQVPVSVIYDGVVVGTYVTDLIVGGRSLWKRRLSVRWTGRMMRSV